MNEKQYWLMKSEPEAYSIDQLEKDKTTWWENIRNYQARNFMMNTMKVGDKVLFYHSNANPSGIAGIAEISKAAQPDKSQFDKKNEYFDAKATLEKPIWHCVQIKYLSKFKKLIPLEDLKKEKTLSNMYVLKKGQRLSIQPVSESEYKHILKMADLKE